VKCTRKRALVFPVRRRYFALCRRGTHQGDGLTIARGEMKNAHTKRQRQNRHRRIFQEDGEFCPEPKTASLIALYGDEVSYAWNVLEDLKVAGASYTRRNIIADMFRRLGVK
jgi:hypothetical protein